MKNGLLLQKQHKEALNIFADKHKKNKNVIAILLSWSFIHSIPDKNSDLDVYIVLKSSKMRERWNTRINGVEIEYFINPVEQIRKYFATEIWSVSPSTAHMFANSIILYQQWKIVNQLIKEAKVCLTKKPSKINKISLELFKYKLDDTKKDLEDVYLRNDLFAFNIIANELLTACLDVFLRIKRVSKEKTKRLQNYLNKLDTKFEKLYETSVIETNIEKKYNAVIKTVAYVENLIGWKRTKERKLKSKTTF